MATHKYTTSPDGDNPTQEHSLPCLTCSHFEPAEYDDVGYLWASAYCLLGLWLPVRKMACKRHSSRTAPAGGVE